MSLKKVNFYGHFICGPFFAGELFEGLSVRTSQNLDGIRRRKEVKSNNTLLAAGDLPRCAYILRSGCARVSYRNGINGKLDSRMMQKDEVFGLNEIVANSFCEMDLTTVTPCVFECLRRGDLIRFLSREPEACFKVLHTLSHNLRQNYSSFAESTF